MENDISRKNLSTSVENNSQDSHTKRSTHPCFFFFNNQQILSDYVTTLNSKADHLECTNAGMLLSGWNAGNYPFRIVASFDEKINDGISDYAAENIMFAKHSQVIRSDVTKKCNKC